MLGAVIREREIMGVVTRSSDPAVRRPSVVSLATLRAGQILDWTNVDKTALIVLCPLPFLVIVLMRIRGRMFDPSIEPFLDLYWLTWVDRALVFAIMAQLAFVLPWTWFRVKKPESRPFAAFALSLFFATIAFGGFVVGPVTTPILGALLATICAVLLLFEPMLASALASFGILAYFAPLLLVAFDVVPYAPVLRGSNFAASDIADEWILATTAFAVGITVVPAVLLGGVVRRWRSRDAALLELARFDPLTHVANRRFFFDRLQIELERSRRHESKLAVMLLDLDFFKRVNDCHGHLIGDTALVHVSELLVHDGLRRIDVVGRYGGEEFAVLFPDTDLEGARAVAERCRGLIETNPCPNPNGPPIKLTVSIGVVEARDDEGVDGVVRRVDAALYRAKSSGRNCVVASR